MILRSLLIVATPYIFTRVAHSYLWYDTIICVIWLIHMCEVTHSFVWRVSFICVTWLICMCAMTHSYVWHDSFVGVTWLMCMCDMTHSCVWHDPFICVTWLIHMCDMTHLYVWCDSSVCVPWLIHMCGVKHSFICVTPCIPFSGPLSVWCDVFLFFAHSFTYVIFEIYLICMRETRQVTLNVCVTWLTDSSVWHDSFLPCDLARWYVW